MSTTATPINAATQTRGPERPRYYPRQIVTADDLNLAQDYFRDKLRRHNRMLHGFGVVCGAELVTSSTAWCVAINPGYLITPCGDDICLEKQVCFDVRKLCEAPSTSTDPCGCQDTSTAPPTVSGTIYIAVRYKEVKSRPVSAPANGCSCNDSGCEFSRWCDAYEICTLTECPASHQNPPSFEQMFHGPAPDCPAKPADNWVVLGSVQVNGSAVTVNGGCTCRRQVASFAGFWWTCSADAPTHSQPNPVTPIP